MIEDWETITNSEYEISNLGRVRRKSALRILKHQDNKGYLSIEIVRGNIRKRYYIHRLVYEAFCGPLIPGLEINHIDGIKSNNRPENLEQITHSANLKHATKLGLVKVACSAGEASGMSKLKASDIRTIRALYAGGGQTQSQIAKMFNTHQTNISKIVRGENWKSVAR